MIEDDDRIRLALVLALEEEGYAATGAATAEEGLVAQRNRPADPVPVDLMRFGSAIVRLYLVREGHLVRVIRRVPMARTPQQQVKDLVAGPTAEERADGLTRALSTMQVGRVTVTDRRATVEIGERPCS